MGVVAALLSMLAVSACVMTVDRGGAQIQLPGTDLVALGRSEFAQACAPCHGIEARGDGPVAPALRVPPPDLTLLADGAGGAFPRDRVVAVIVGDIPLAVHGSREMPIWRDRFIGRSDGAEAVASVYARRWLEAIVSYLVSVQRPVRAPEEA
ncbi:MAG TPA: c-type cytochrome [Candidatus Binatia bacterium]